MVNSLWVFDRFQQLHASVIDIIHVNNANIHVISVKRAPGRFSFHFREVYQKCIEYIGKFLIQMREISKFW